MSEAPPPGPPVTPSHWALLRGYTDARIALGRAGHSMPTQAQLDFQRAHAQARDAVHLPFDAPGLAAAVQGLGLASLLLHSAAADRAIYLQRPDLGRRLDGPSRERLAALAPAQHAGQPGPAASPATPDDRRQAGGRLAFALVDGLSALALHRHGADMLAATLAGLATAPGGPWRLTPVAVVEQGRVAIGDEIGQALGADLVVVLIGERPGLSSPDSLGIYLSWAPRVGLTDASRNCISNIRPAGLAIPDAAAKLLQLLGAARAQRQTGVALKDEHDALAAWRLAPGEGGNFLLPAGGR